MSGKEDELLSLLISRADGGREVGITHEELARKLGLSRKQVRKLLDGLRAEGAIRWTRNGRGNIYTLLHVLPQGNEGNQIALRPDHLPNSGAGTPRVLGKCELLLGRSRELRLLKDYLGKGSSVFLQGPEGVGKTALMLEVYSLACSRAFDGEPIYIPQGSPTKEFLVGLALELVRRSLLEPQNFERLRNAQLARLLYETMRVANKRYLLLIDHVEKLNATQQGVMEPFLEHQVVMASSKPKALRWSHFAVLELSPLDEFSQEALIELFVEDEGLWVEDLPLFKKALLRRSQGNLKKLMGLLERSRIEGRITTEFCHKELGVVEERDYIDVTPVILIGAAIFIGIRFLGLGLGDQELYVLAGMGYAFAWVFRALMWRWRKPKRSSAS